MEEKKNETSQQVLLDSGIGAKGSIQGC